jgi:hypothetical protein
MRLQELFRQVTSGLGPLDGHRVDPGQLRSEIVRYYEAGRLDEAAAAACRLLEWQRKTLGEGHADIATGLTNLARLHLKQGRRNDARPLVAQALHIRLEALGPTHPDVAASRLLLESLQEVGPDRDKPGAGPTQHGGDRAPTQDDRPVTPGTALLLDRLPDHADLEANEPILAAGNDTFEETRDRLLRAVRDLGPPASVGPGMLPASLENPATLRDIAERLEAISGGATPLERAWEIRRRALSMLDSVLSLAPRDGAQIPALHDVLAHARSLRGAIATAPLSGLPRDAFPLARGDHPLAMLLRLAALSDALGDSSWEDLRTAVSVHLGKAISRAAARGRIVFNEREGSTGP